MLKLDKKQKITAGITVIVFLFSIWQVYGLLRGDVSTVATPAPAVAPKSTTPPPTAAPAASVVNTTPLKNETPATSPKNTPITTASNTVDLTNPETTGQHQEYLQMSDQLQLARMQAQLLSQQLAVVQAKKQIADLNQQTSQLMAATSNVTGSDNLLDLDQNKLRLVYIAKVSGQWTATVLKDGNYQSVNVGSLLPNGALVVRINKKGLLFRSGDEFKLMSFDGTMSVRDPSGNTAEKNSSDMTMVLVPTAMPNHPTAAPASASTTAVAPPPSATSTPNTATQKKLQLNQKSVDILKSQ